MSDPTYRAAGASSTATMGTAVARGSAPTADASDVGVREARHKEDVVVGEEIVRHSLLSRVIHWTVAITMAICLFTGLPIWTPIFGWMASLFGGLQVCRWLHPWAGLAFVASSFAMVVYWFSEMKLEKRERDWLGPKLITYLKYQGDDPEVGKYNGGQKMFFFTIPPVAVLLLLSGVALWFPMSVTGPIREISWLLHDVSFIFLTVLIIGHIYLGTAAEPGTFQSMTRGTVTKRWARFHHPRWYREVTGEQTKR